MERKLQEVRDNHDWLQNYRKRLQLELDNAVRAKNQSGQNWNTALQPLKEKSRAAWEKNCGSGQKYCRSGQNNCLSQ